jgi:hypothetical protein
MNHPVFLLFLIYLIPVYLFPGLLAIPEKCGFLQYSVISHKKAKLNPENFVGNELKTAGKGRNALL